MAARNVRIGAEKAALAALKQDAQRRAALVGAAAETQARIDTLIGDLLAAFDAHDAAFAAAAGEWSKSQLEGLGVQEDPASGARRALRRLVRPAPQDDAGSASPAATPVAPATVPAAAQ